MAEYTEENCPLCDKAANYYFVDHGNRKFFRCGHCNDFQVYINAENLLSESPEQNKLEMSTASHNSQHEKVMFITAGFSSTTPSLYELRVEFHDRATLPLS